MQADASEEPFAMGLRVVIFGSCVSRDILNVDAGQQVELVAYYARSSFASAFSKNAIVDVYSENLSSAFQQRTVNADLTKRFFRELSDLSFDVLLIDLIDERFNLFAFDSGDICTLSSELLGTGFPPENHPGEKIISGSDHFFELWESGWRIFITKIEQLGLRDRIRINKVYWAERTESFADFLPTYSDRRIKAANCFLDRLYERIAEDLDQSQFLVFDQDRFVGGDRHRWGLSPFHYIDDYYKEALEKVLMAGLACASTSSDTPSPSRQWCDYGKWGKPVFSYPNLDAALTFGFRSDGIHRVSFGSESIDLLIQGNEMLHAGAPMQPLLIAFNGAVSQRNGQCAPFFSGLGMAQTLRVPLLAISDPTMTRSCDLRLAWYAGNALMPNLPDLIARIIGHIARTFGCKPILFGGSGGGFAVLSVLPRLDVRATGLVWNPQTSIGEYVASEVINYLRSAFPASADNPEFDRSASPAKRRSAINSVLAGSGIDHDLTTKWGAGIGELLYLQNCSDWHVRSHAGPYLRQTQWERLSPHAFRQTKRDVACWFGSWGDGHVAPNRKMLEETLASIIAGRSVIEIAASLDESEVQANPILWFDVDGAPSLMVSTEWRDGEIVARSTLGEDMAGSQPEYAFYLMEDGQRVGSRMYSNDSTASFCHHDRGGKLEVAAFIRDSIGTIKMTRAPVPPLPLVSTPKLSSLADYGGLNSGGHEILSPTAFSDSEALNAKVYWSSVDAASHSTYIRRQQWSEDMAFEIARHSPSSVFEFGCNVGKNLLAVRDKIPTAHLAGVDINQVAVVLARESGLDVQVGDELSLEAFSDGSFDISFTVSVLAHLPQPEVALKELARISRQAVYLLEPWLGNEGKVVRNYNRGMSCEIETTPFSYSWNYQELIKGALPGWTCVWQPMPLPTNLGAFYFLFELIPSNGLVAQAL